MKVIKSWPIQEASTTKRTRVEDSASSSSLKRWFTSQISNMNAEVTHFCYCSQKPTFVQHNVLISVYLFYRRITVFLEDLLVVNYHLSVL